MSYSADVQRILKDRFLLSQLRPGQKEVIESVLSKRDTLVVMPTGSGKSLCFQIPAALLGGVCLVVSPLIALMQDQVKGLKAKGFLAGSLHSGMTSAEKLNVLNELQSHYKKPTQELESYRSRDRAPYFLFVSPERLSQEAFLIFLKSLNLQLIVIDEAHCILEWGFDFRPDYQKLHILKESFEVPILALTASATPIIRKEIIKYLKLKNSKQLCFGFFRSKLFNEVKLCSDFESKLKLTARAIEKISEGRILIYCATRLQCETVAERLKLQFQAIAFYHAGLTTAQRTEIQNQLNDKRLRILCCTCAFGMGIDYPDVRLVVHFEVPTSIEELYQESGRAGRDQAAAHILTLFTERDLVRKALQVSSHNRRPGEANRRIKALRDLESYLKLKKCRHYMISEYFGDFLSFQNSKECGVCDVCCGFKNSLEANGARTISHSGLRNRITRIRQRDLT